MHAITLSYSLSYAAAVRLGIARSGADTVDADGVLPLLDERERAWLAQHPKATFALDTVVESAADLTGPRLSACLAREIRSACAADDPARLRAVVAAQLVRALDDARAGEHVSVYVSVQRRVSDGASTLSGGVDVLTDADVGPGLLTALDRYMDRCLAALRRPSIARIEDAPGLLRAAYDDGEARIVDRAVRCAIEASHDGPLPGTFGLASWGHKLAGDGALGVEAVVDGKGTRSWRVASASHTFRDPRLAAVIEDSIRAVEAKEAAERDAQAVRAATDAILVAVGEAAICSALDPEQVQRRALGALPDGELAQALLDDLVRRIERAVGPDYSVGPLDADDVRWGELPRGGSDVARALDQLACVDEWGDGSTSKSGPIVAVAAVALDGTEHLLCVDPVDG
jgi:hypothetical protein